LTPSIILTLLTAKFKYSKSLSFLNPSILPIKLFYK
jgi:hypothetical protein